MVRRQRVRVGVGRRRILVWVSCDEAGVLEC